MDKIHFTVEGLKCDNLESANTLAKRFYNRYNKQKDITIKLKTEEKSDAWDVITYHAVNDPLVECPNTIDMFK